MMTMMMMMKPRIIKNGTVANNLGLNKTYHTRINFLGSV